MFNRNVEFEVLRLKELDTVIKKYIAEYRYSNNTNEKEDYDFLDGTDAFVQGILKITDTEDVILNDFSSGSQDYCIAFAGDCIDMLSNILMNEL